MASGKLPLSTSGCITQIGLGVTSSDQNLLKLEFKYNTPNQTGNNGLMREQKTGTGPTGGPPGSGAYDADSRIPADTNYQGSGTVTIFRDAFSARIPFKVEVKGTEAPVITPAAIKVKWTKPTK